MKFRKGVCPWTEQLCPSTCPVPSVDNQGNHYPGCALARLKTLAEMLGDSADRQVEVLTDAWPDHVPAR